MALLPWSPAPGSIQLRRLTYATYDEPRYSRLLVLVRETPHISAVLPQLASFGDVEEVWGPLTDLNDHLQGPVFVKFARSSQALRLLEAFRTAPPLSFPHFTQIYMAQSRVPGNSNELEMDLHKLTVIHVTIPRSFTETILRNRFKVYGVIVSCIIIRIEFGESEDLGYIGFSMASEAAFAIEECNKSFQAVWAEPKPDYPAHPVLRLGVYGAQQRTTKREVQEATLNTMCKNTSLANNVTEPSKVSESKTPVNNPKQKTACKEVQGSSATTLDKSTSLAKVVIEPSKLSASKSDVNNSKPKTTSSEVQKSSMNTLGKDTKQLKSAMKPVASSKSKYPANSPEHKTTRNKVEVSSSNTLHKDTKRLKSAMKPVASSESKYPANNPEHKTTRNKVEVSNSNTLRRRSKWDQPPTSPSVICTENKTIRSEIQWNNLIPVVSGTTFNVPVTRTESEPGVTEQNTINCIIPGSNLIILGPEPESSTSSRSNIEQKGSRTCKSNLIDLGYHTSEVQQVCKPPEHSGYEYYVDGTDYGTALSEPSMQPPDSDLDYYYTSVVEQQTDDHSIKESNVMTSEKSLKSSEWKFYMGGARRKKKSQGNSLLTSVDPPDLASVKRSNSRKQESISRHLLMVSEFLLTQEQICGLFDVIPGLESCKVRPGLHSKRVYAIIQYRNVASAVYAKRRLHDLEYPLGNQLHISFIEDKIHGTELLQEMATQLVTSHLASVIWDNNWAPQLLRSTESSIPTPRIQTDAVLPSYKRKAPPDSPVREKLLIIFDPGPLPQNILDNVLSRFGNFIASHLIHGKNGAYGMFAERASAGDAIAVLHGKTVNDVKLKVTLSDLPMEDFSKRQRLF